MAYEAPKDKNVKKKKSRVDFGAKHIIIEPKNISNHTGTIIWCHGLGDTGAGWKPAMVPIAAKYPYIRFVLPTAPSLAVTMNGGMSMPAWHDIESLSELMKNKFEYKEDCKEIITQLIDQEFYILQTSLYNKYKENNKKQDICKKEDINCDGRILLGGFSQGAAMGIYSGLCYDRCKLAGIISLSGYLCDFDLFNQFSKKQYPHTNVLMYHGSNDMIVQTAFGKMSYEYLKNVCQLKNIQFKLANVPQWMNVGHGTTEEEMTDVTNYIGKWLPEDFDLKTNNDKKSNDQSSSNDKDEQKKNE